MQNSRTHHCLMFAVSLAMFLVWNTTGCSQDEGLKVKRVSRKSGIPGDSMAIYGTGFQTGGVKSVQVFFVDKKGDRDKTAKVLRIKGNEEILVEIPGGIDFGRTVDIKLVFEPGGEITLKQAFTYQEPTQTTVDDLVDKSEK